MSMKIKLSPGGCQANGVKLPGVLLTRNIFRLNSSPDPFSGVKSSEKAEMRRILDVGPPPGRMLAETFQLTAVSPADATNAPTPGPVVPKLATVESKTKSPWNPTYCSSGSMNVVLTG